MGPKKQQWAHSELTDEDKLRIEMNDDYELQQMQGVYRMRKSEKNMTVKASKLDRVISLYEKEMMDLKTNVDVAMGPLKIREDAVMSKHIVELLHEYDFITDSINRKKAKMIQLDIILKRISKQLTDMKSQQVSDLAMQKRELAGQKTLGELENKLEVQMKKFGQICFENRKLRYEIDRLFNERLEFNKTWDGLITKLGKGKRYLMDLIEQATKTFDTREEMCKQLQFLREKAKNDFAQDTELMSKLCRKADANSGYLSFIAHKNQRRLMTDIKEMEMNKRRREQERIQNNIKEWQQILDDIYEFADTDNLTSILELFERVEKGNFATFRYINELNQEISELNDNLLNLHVEIDEEKVLRKIRKNQQEANLEKLRKQLKEEKAQVACNDRKLIEVTRSLDQITEGIGVLFKLCGCKRDPLIKLIGGGTTTIFNLALHVNILEDKVTEKLVEVYHKEKYLVSNQLMTNEQRLLRTERPGKPSIYSIDQIVTAHPCPLCVEHEQVSDIIDTLQKILSKRQVVEKLQARLKLPDGLYRVHNVSECNLPKSRELMQKRYQ